MQRFGAKLQDEQEVLLWLADLAIDTYAAESAVLRAQAATGAADAAAHEDAARVFVSDAVVAGRDDGPTECSRPSPKAMCSGRNLAALRRLLKTVPADTVAARRRLADATVQRGGYVFSVQRT